MAMNVVIDMIKRRLTAEKNGTRRCRYTAGFTMAEMLIVVAIIGVLAAVSFIAVQAHQRSMTQLQYDAIAKEIFVAAQNHLTLAKSENYQQKSDLSTAFTNGFFGTKGEADADTNDDIYYFTSTSSNTETALDQILPFGSVELVTGGSFIIRYQPKAARVLDVFYWTDDARYGISSVDYDTAVDGYRDTEDSSKKDARSKYESSGILGWCGGEGIVDSGEYLEAPEIEVINAEMLLVTVTDPNMGKSALAPQLKLLVTGNLSGAKVAIPLALASETGRIVPLNNGKQYTVVLDDITTEEFHFADLQNETAYTFKKDGDLSIPFIPGENLTIQAVAYSNTVLTSVAYSGEWTTNSLFGEVTEDLSGSTPVADKVFIGNIRHLENLNDGLSSVDYSDDYFNNVVSAVQTADLDWSTFKTALNTLKKDKLNDSVDAITTFNVYDKNNAKTKDDCFLPVTVAAGYTLTYDGQNEVELTEGEITTTIKENHSIKGVVVDNTGEAAGTATIASGGVFGTLTGATIKNLELKNIKINMSAGNAGTLAGELTGSTVENVVAYNTSNYEAELTDLTTVTTANGNAGGLVGVISAKTELSKCTAAVIVNATSGNAGGLVGTATSTAGALCRVIACYSGGHTINSTLTGSNAVVYDATNYNVTATASGTTGGVAGGLIGSATATEITYCYSTCSATGATVGGLIGTGSGAITNSYCTGLVKSTAATPVEGAFAGSWTYTGKTDDDGNWYFDIINEREEKDDSGNLTGGYTYLYPVSGSEAVKGLTALDESAAQFNTFCGASSDWKTATPYNDKLKDYYGEGTGDARVAKYNLKTIEQLMGGTDPLKADDDDTTEYFVATHYGDWPAPEIFVINTAS